MSDLKSRFEGFRKQQPDLAFCTLFAPAEHTEACLTLLDLYNEWSQIPEKVSEPLLGMVRITWWRDSLESLFGLSKTPVPPHPSLQQLDGIKDSLKPELFWDMLKSVEADLYSDAPEDVATLERYLQHKMGCLQLQLLNVLAPDASPALQKAVSHGATAYAYIELFRQTPRLLPRSKPVFPADLAQKHGFKLDLYGSEQAAEAVCNMVLELLTRVDYHINAARAVLQDVPAASRKQAKAVLMPLYLTEFYSKKLRRMNGDILRKPFPHRGALGTLKLMLEAKKA